MYIYIFFLLSSEDNFFIAFRERGREREKHQCEPWLLRLRGWSTGLGTKGSLVQFPVRAYAWVVGQVPSWGCTRGN